jgi:hypothetical protein
MRGPLQALVRCLLPQALQKTLQAQVPQQQAQV